MTIMLDFKQRYTASCIKHKLYYALNTQLDTALSWSCVSAQTLHARLQPRGKPCDCILKMFASTFLHVKAEV